MIHEKTLDHMRKDCTAMKNQRLKLTAILMSLLLAVLPLCGLAEAEVKTDLLTLGDQQVVHDGEVVNAGSEGWQYDAVSGTLTLDSAVINGYKENARGMSGLYCTGDLHIVLNGENMIDLSEQTVEGSPSAICVLGSLTISGPGSLTARGANGTVDAVGIYAIRGLTILGASVTAEGGEGMRSFGMACRDGITVEEGAVVTAMAGEGKVLSSGLYVGQGSISISNSAVTAKGGAAVRDASVPETETASENCGIWCKGQLSINGSTVVAEGGNVQAGDAFTGYSNGIYTEGGVDMDFESDVAAAAGNAQGNSAFSCGVNCCYGNVAVYSASLKAVGAEAHGIASAVSCGAFVKECGFYTYESGADVTLVGGQAEATAADGVAHANGLRVVIGDAGIEQGKASITGGAAKAAGAEANAMNVLGGKEDGGILGGCVTFGEEVAAELAAENGIAVWAMTDLTVENEEALNGKVHFRGEKSYEAEYWFLADNEGQPLTHATIAPAV